MSSEKGRDAPELIGTSKWVHTMHSTIGNKAFNGGRRVGACSYTAQKASAIGIAHVVRFVFNLNLLVWLSIAVAICCTYWCITHEIYWNGQIGVLISPVSFPLAFSINQSYRKRESSLMDFGAFFSAASSLFWMHRDWEADSGVNESVPDHAKYVLQHIREVLKSVIEFSLGKPSAPESAELQSTVYRLLSRLAQANDTMRMTSNWDSGEKGSIILLYTAHRAMVDAFEKIRITREYRTPRRYVALFLCLPLCATVSVSCILHACVVDALRPSLPGTHV
jgi:hypothetical protein